MPDDLVSGLDLCKEMGQDESPPVSEACCELLGGSASSWSVLTLLQSLWKV